MTTVECRDNHIRAIQCLQSTYAETLNTAVSLYGKNSECVIETNNQVTAFLRLLCDYSPFTTTLENAFKITFASGTTPSTFEGTIGGNAFNIALNGTTGEARALEAYNGLLSNSDFITQKVAGLVDMVLDGSILYFWSYPSIVLTISATTGVTTEDIESSPCAILDLINCLTTKQVCDILNKTYELLGVNC
jgi:hypothetical protein